MQKDLDKLINWASDWQMEFNLDKCKVMHFGYDNRRKNYNMKGKNLQKVEEEKDLRVIISSDLKVAVQCGAAARKGYQVLGMISRTFTCKKKAIMVKLYKSLVRPHLDYCIQVWRTHLVKDIEKI